MSKSLVSIIVPCFNSAKFLDECLNSVYNQTYSNWEVIIVNDGSTDNTDSILEKWINIDQRFKYIKKENSGVAKTRILGIQNSKGKYLLPLDADDYISPTFLEKTVTVLDNDLNIEVVFSDVQLFGVKTEIFKLEKYSLKYLLQKNCIVSTALFRKETYDKVGGYCADLRSLEDWDLWISILKNGGEIYKINEVLFYYRTHSSGSLTNNLFKDLGKYQQYHNIIFKRHSDAFLEHVGNPILIKRELERLKEKQSLPLRKKFTNQIKDIYSRIIK